MRPFLTTLLLCLLCPAFAQPAKQYAFTHLTTADGLPSNIINSIAQDEAGFMWFATIEGLSRYDGYHFQNFLMPRNSTFSLANVAVLYNDRHHNLWVFTNDNRAGIFNPRNFTLQEVNTKVMQRSSYLPMSFLELQDGNLLLQEFYGRTYRFDASANALVVDSTSLPRPKGWQVSRSVWDALEKKYWLAADSGLALYNPATKLLSYRGHNVEHNAAIERFKNEMVLLYVAVDQQGNLNFHNWPPNFGNPFLHIYLRKTGESLTHNLSNKLPIAYHEIGELLQQRNGRMWIYGHPILAEWLPDRKNFVPVLNEYRTEQSIRYDYVYTMLEDKEGNIWTATDNGLFFFNPDAQLFDNYNFTGPNDKQLHDYNATSLLQLQDSSFFVGTWGPGLFVFDKMLNPQPLPQSLNAAMAHNRSVWNMLQHSKTGNVWLTLQGGELVVYNPKTKSAKLYAPPIFEKRTIRQITEDHDGNLWFGTHTGALIKWDYKLSGGNPSVGYTLLFKGGLVLKLTTDSRGFVWVAMADHGVAKVDPRQNKVVHVYNTDSSALGQLTHNVATDIIQYNDSLMIAVANSLNIINTNTNRISHITAVEGLPSNTAQCIQRDADGVLWVGMRNGLCRINLQKGLGTTYDRRNGIAYDNFNPAGAFQTLDGRFAFTTDHNFVLFDPKKFSASLNTPADPAFSSFSVSGKPLSVDSLRTTGKLVLPYDNNSITIEFSTLNFLKQKQPDYVYILEGFDKGWNQIYGSNKAIYSYLPPGHYLFKVKAINQDGVFSKSFAHLTIIIEPPFWRTWWFFGVVALFGLLMLYLIDRERRKRQQALQTVRTQIAGDLHNEINVTLNDINLLSEIAKIKADKDIDRSKDYIDQISTKSRTMIESMDDILWSIHPENDSMQRMLLRLTEFTDGLKKTNDLDVELSVDTEVESLAPDMKTRHEILLFYKDALLYIMQHSVCSTIYVGLEYYRSKLALKMLAQCNQIDNPAGQTAQLEYSMQRRADALNGMLDIISDHKSISIILQVPV